jgi:hypothetical protein
VSAVKTRIRAVLAFATCDSYWTFRDGLTSLRTDLVVVMGGELDQKLCEAARDPRAIRVVMAHHDDLATDPPSAGARSTQSESPPPSEAIGTHLGFHQSARTPPSGFAATWMRSNGLTQTELANKVGIVQSTISAVLSGSPDCFVQILLSLHPLD